MAYVISASFEEHPSPYPWCEIRKELAPGQEHLSWNDIHGGPVRPEWQPRSVLRAFYEPEEGYVPYNPDISFVTGGAPCLSAAARDMIEALEPGVHQFFPVDIYNSDGTIREPRRYILNVCQLADAIVEGTFAVLNNGERLYHASSFHPVKIRRQDVSRLHIWRNKHASNSKLFISDALRQKIFDAGYTAFDVGIAEEI